MIINELDNSMHTLLSYVNMSMYYHQHNYFSKPYVMTDRVPVLSNRFSIWLGEQTLGLFFLKWIKQKKKRQHITQNGGSPWQCLMVIRCSCLNLFNRILCVLAFLWHADYNGEFTWTLFSWMRLYKKVGLCFCYVLRFLFVYKDYAVLPFCWTNGWE